MHQIALPELEAIVTLNPCPTPPPAPVVTTAAPVRAHQSLYVAARDCLYALNAADGMARWCQQVKLTRTREVIYPRGMSVPPPPRVTFAAPRVDNGVVYVCLDGFGSYTCAFNAGDGSLRWWTPTDARVMSMPFMDWAVPQVKDGIVYSGTYALNAQDGSVLWRIAIDTRGEGTVALPALAGGTLCAATHRGVYAISAQDGQIRWLYQPDEYASLSGPPIASGRLLYAGARGSIGHEEESYFCALGVETGAESWRYPNLNPWGSYIGAVVDDETIYVHSGDRYLYALDKNSGMPRWQHRFAATGYYPATIANDVLYITIHHEGAYALSSADGAVLWHQPLDSNPGITFLQPVVLDGAVYLVRNDKRGWGVLYALDARDGAECWHTPYPRYSLAAPLAIAQ